MSIFILDKIEPNEWNRALSNAARHAQKTIPIPQIRSELRRPLWAIGVEVIQLPPSLSWLMMESILRADVR